MQIQQQHQLLYNRVTADDVAEAALTSGYSAVGGDVIHHRQKQQQQSIEMTQFEVTSSGREDAYQKSLKHQHKNTVGRYNDDNDIDRGDVDKIKPMNTGGTMGRRRRGSQQVLDGGGGSSLSDHYYIGGIGGSSQHLQQYHHHHQQQHGNRRRSNTTSIGGDGPPVKSAANNNYNTAAANNSYNTVSGVGYYAADVYASMGTRQQQSKRQSQQQQQQRSYCGVGTASAGNVSDEQSLTAKRSWRRQQNRHRRAGVGGGVVAVEPDDDAEKPQPAVDACDYAADAETEDDPPSPTPQQPLTDRYRNVTATAELDHHHRPRQKTDVRNNPPGGGPTAAAAQQQGNGAGGGANKNMVKFHDVGREIDV